VWFVRVKLSLAGDPARQRPALAQVTIDVDGDLVRAQVTARELREAIDLLQHRLRDQLEHRAQHRQTMHRSSGVSETGEWRRGDLPEQRSPYFDRAPEERQLVRHKTFAVGEMTPDEAAFDMDQLDYDFHLFTETGTGIASVLYRDGATGYRLAQVISVSEDRLAPFELPLTVSSQPAPCITVEEAIERLGLLGLPFLFFIDAAQGRAGILYRRYDGHYGLIAPAG
jgi:hypothetical protein